MLNVPDAKVEAPVTPRVVLKVPDAKDEAPVTPNVVPVSYTHLSEGAGGCGHSVGGGARSRAAVGYSAVRS